ncbi:MAG: gamma-glutamyl-gamma-aminobutyrate hydrolase family protein [Myxococcaceae bacterium]|nr:gamma-glutamyl-gamma-aminobutyrate hydrolase family protein [Myxococcaceae bacterium]
MRPPHGHGHHPPRRPSIGITPDVTAITKDAPLAKYDLKVAYADAVLRAGGLPFVLPYSDDRAVIEAYLDRISGVVITGGAFDIPPEAYGESARDGLGVLKPGRTAFESLVIHAALARNLPVLGVCGGMQLLNVALGGTLYQDIGKEMPNARPHEQTHDRTQPAHPIDIKEGTVLADCVGKGQLMVNSTHHQAVKAVGPKLVVTATSPDGVIEAIEAPTHTFAVGVQWHPELLIDSVPPHLGLYKTFVARAREQRR